MPSADPAERSFRFALALVEGGVPILEAWPLVSRETGNPSWEEAARRLQEGAGLSECIPGLPSTLRPIVRHGERSGRLLEFGPHLRTFWSRPLDPRVPFYYLSQMGPEAGLGKSLKEAREFEACHPGWTTLGAATDPASAARSSVDLFTPPLNEAVATAAFNRRLPEVFAALGRACEAGLFPFGDRADRSRSLRRGLFALAALIASGKDLDAALAATVPTIPHAPTRKGFAELRAETFPEAPTDFLPPGIRALLRHDRGFRDVGQALEYAALVLPDA